jgi:hypothetical protein
MLFWFSDVFRRSFPNPFVGICNDIGIASGIDIPVTDDLDVDVYVKMTVRRRK